MTRTRFLKSVVVAAGVAIPGLVMAQTATPGGTTRPAQPPSAAAPAQPATPPAAAAMPTDPVRVADARRASKIIGADIYNEQNRSIGEVHDLMVAPTGVPTAVLSVGGFLGLGERYVAVPFSTLQWNAERERWVMPGATVDSLKARPAFTYPQNS